MRTILYTIVLALFVLSCDQAHKTELKEGSWHAELQVSDNEVLPFNFTLSKEAKGNYELTISNASEEILVDEIWLDNDSIVIKMAVFEGYIAGTFSDTRIEGQFIKESLERYVPFIAEYGNSPRFKTEQEPATDVSGNWEVEFDYDKEGEAYPAKGIFSQNGNIVTGTFRTKTGDYRYLEGVMDGNQLKLSAFDGAHAFLFSGFVTDSTLNGKFYSGNHDIENFKGKRNETFELADADSLTFLKEGHKNFEFSFPNEKGEQVSLSEPEFQGKVVLVQIMGTWCPNCLDETKYYVDYLENNPNTDLKVISLAFEYAKTEEKAWRGIERLKKRVGVNYPILLAQVGSSSKTKANEKLPMLNHVLSYPTTIYIDKNGDVRKIHTGFNGPATGEKHEEFKRDFSTTLESLLSE